MKSPVWSIRLIWNWYESRQDYLPGTRVYGQVGQNQKKRERANTAFFLTQIIYLFFAGTLGQIIIIVKMSC